MASSSKVVECTPRLKSPLQRVPVQEETPKHIIENGDFRIDLLSRRVTVCGREGQLNSEEFDLLVFLAKHPRKVVTPILKWARDGDSMRRAKRNFCGFWQPCAGRSRRRLDERAISAPSLGFSADLTPACNLLRLLRLSIFTNVLWSAYAIFTDSPMQ